MKKLVLALTFVAVVLGFVACSSNTYTVHVYTWDGSEYKDTAFSGLKTGDYLSKANADTLTPGDDCTGYYELTAALTDTEKKVKIVKDADLPKGAVSLSALTSVKVANKDVYVVASYIPKEDDEQKDPEPEKVNLKANFYLYDFGNSKYSTNPLKAYTVESASGESAAVPANDYKVAEETSLTDLKGVKYLVEVVDTTSNTSEYYKFAGWTATNPATETATPFATGTTLEADKIVATKDGANYYSVYEKVTKFDTEYAIVKLYSISLDAANTTETLVSKDYYIYVGAEANATAKFNLLPAGADRTKDDANYKKFHGYYTSSANPEYTKAVHLIKGATATEFFVGDDATGASGDDDANTTTGDTFNLFDNEKDLVVGSYVVYPVYKAFVAEFYAWDGSKYDVIDTKYQADATAIAAPALEDKADKPAGIILAIEITDTTGAATTKYYKFKGWLKVENGITLPSNAISVNTTASEPSSFVAVDSSVGAANQYFANYEEVTTVRTVSVVVAEDRNSSNIVTTDAYLTGNAVKDYKVIDSSKFADFVALLTVADRTKWTSFAKFDKWVTSSANETNVLHEATDASSNTIYVADDYAPNATPAVTTKSVGTITPLALGDNDKVTADTVIYAVYKAASAGA